MHIQTRSFRSRSNFIDHFATLNIWFCVGVFVKKKIIGFFSLLYSKRLKSFFLYIEEGGEQERDQFKLFGYFLMFYRLSGWQKIEKISLFSKSFPSFECFMR